MNLNYKREELPPVYSKRDKGEKTIKENWVDGSGFAMLKVLPAGVGKFRSDWYRIYYMTLKDKMRWHFRYCEPAHTFYNCLVLYMLHDDFTIDKLRDCDAKKIVSNNRWIF